MNFFSRSIPLICGLLTLTACCHVWRPITYQNFIPKQADELRIANYNVNYGEPDWPKRDPLPTIEAIRHVNADIIFLEEVSNSRWKTLIDEHLARQYPYRFIDFHFPNDGCGVLSKYPVRVIQTIPSIIGWFPAWIVEVEVPHRTIQFLNFHLIPSFSIERNPNYPDTPILKRPPLRKKEVLHFYSYVDPRKPTMVLGDFNEGEDGKSYHFLLDQGLIDALGFVPHYSLQHTWYWIIPGFTPAKRYDHLFYKPGTLQPIRTQILYEGNSDHYPVVVDFVQ